MEDKGKLRLIKSPSQLGEANNFWRTCPLSLEFLPETPCEHGRPTLSQNSKRIQEEPKCPWWINSKEFNYCFWRYLQEKSSPEGVMPELVQSDLAQLFGWSNTKTHFILKEATEELTTALKLYGALELLKEMDSDDFDGLDSATDLYADLCE